jgi:hypothetical protein
MVRQVVSKKIENNKEDAEKISKIHDNIERALYIST